VKRQAGNVTISIIVADDNDMIRLGVRTLLEAELDFRVVGETGNGTEASLLVDRLKPDVLVLAMMLPGLHGLDVLKAVRIHSPDTRAIMFSMHDDPAYLVEALRSGAAGYVLKQGDPAALVMAIRLVHAGQTYLSPLNLPDRHRRPPAAQ
jgi:DNA-binding NarL/FixJ family response regulator